MASPAFGALGTLTSVNNTTSVPRPSVSAGDLMVMFVCLSFANATFTPPSGWTLGDAYDNGGLFNSEFRYYWKLAGGSEPTSYSVTISGQSGGNNFGGAVIGTWTGTDQTTPIQVVAQAQSGTATTTIPCPSVTTTTADTTIVCFYADRSATSAETFTPPSGMTERFDAKLGTSGEAAGIADMAFASAGATGTLNATSSLSEPYVAFTFAIASPVVGGTVNLTGANCSQGATSGTGAVTLGGAIINLAGAAASQSATSGTGGATIVPLMGTFTTLPLKNNTGTVLASETGVTLNIYNASSGALVVQKTGVTTNGSGIATVTDALIVAGTTYAYEPVLSGGRRRLPTKAAT